MTRVVARVTSAQAAMRTRSRVLKPKKHKIIMESITQEKKKLRSVISFEAKAPPGYTFIPAGNPKFTNACKEMCRQDGLQVFAVSTTPHQRMHDLSQQVHRIGYHFPSVVVATICMELGLFLSSTGKVVPYSSSQYPVKGLGRERRADSEVSQNTINVEAKDAIKDLFPSIPTKDLNRIIKTAFQKGKRKVGTAVELPLARRVQLAVVAHIRHVYTDYDRLLRITSFQDARAAVEEPTLAKLVQWRGDDENGKTVLEDVFREVIVISDDEDDEDESDLADEGFSREGRQSSVEIVSSSALAGELQTRPMNYGHLPSGDREAAQDFSEDEAPSGFRFIPQLSRKKRTADKKRADRRGFSRYEAWDRARDRYKAGEYLPNTTRPDDCVVERYSVPPTMQDTLQETTRLNSHHTRPLLVHVPIPPGTRTARPNDSTNEARFNQPLSSTDHPPLDSRPYFLEPNKSRPGPPDRIQLADGAVFERADINTWPEQERIVQQPKQLPPTLVSPNLPETHTDERRFRIPTGNLHPPSRRGGDISEYQEQRVLPSIEGPELPSRFRNQGVGQPDLLPRKRVPDDFPPYYMKPANPPIEEVSGKMNVININEDRHISQKRRVEYNTIRGSSPMDRGRDRVIISLPQGPYDFPAYRKPGLSDVSYFYTEQQQLSSNERSEDLGHHLERVPLGTKRPFDPVPSSSHFSSGLSDRPEHGHRYGAPGLHEARHGLSSRNLLESPRFVSASDEPSFKMVRNDGRPVRPNHVPSFNHPQPQIFDHEDFVNPRGPSSFRDASRPVFVTQEPPIRRKLLPDENTRISSLHSHDFVRPVNLQDADGSISHEPQGGPARPASPRKTRYVPRGAFKAYDRVRAESQADRPHSPQPFTSRVAPVHEPNDTFYIGPNSPPRTGCSTLNPPQPSSVLYDSRVVRLPIDDDGRRYPDDDGMQHHVVLRDGGLRWRPRSSPLL
ncbi:hypothetical protein BDBG_09115 [Blastomyces gilchristii SLH14081]|uniref:DUF2293 domain-containing protein n=1 Tax=Blastomyces gilchristii (strain SLH14081) TaxID=559298 RepID=A0A179V5U3_BLAGS|nr:uncharacterized protein BDBG_09115 [Blastomyces gilchristii SLH14081]OAT14022.1 hypothetical protein BDBG_09115 [Blastomyces gilchristii SLH14081]